MRRGRNGKWLGMAAAIAVAVVVFLIIGRGDDGGDRRSNSGAQAQDVPAAAPSKPLASTTSASENADDGGLRFDLMSLNRDGDYVVAQIKLVNEANEALFVSGSLLGGNWTESPPGGYSDVSGFALADPDSRRLYTVLREPDQRCLCTDTDGLDSLQPGRDTTVYAVFPAPPASSKAITVINPIGPPFPSVAVQDGPPPKLPRSDAPPDLESVSPDEPAILPIESLTDSLDRSRSVVEDAREVDIRLATDVLFAVNSARLSRRARGILADTARQLEAAGAKTVRLEGHADSSGDDSINEPLSRRRARAVVTALEPRVGGDVRFSSRGFGSRKPIASNDDEGGRRRNRRVSVVYPRPDPSEEDEQEADESDSVAPEGEPVSGQTAKVIGADNDAGEAVDLELESLQAIGSLVLLTYTATGAGQDDSLVTTLLDDPDNYDQYRFSRSSVVGPTLLDRENRQRYRVAAVTGGEQVACLCTDTAGVQLGTDNLGRGETVRLYSAFVVPPDVSTVTLELAGDTKLPDLAIDRD